MGKSKFLALLLISTIANLSVYLPLKQVTPCSCSKQEQCRLEHDCPHCQARKKTSAAPMCHSRKQAPVAKLRHAECQGRSRQAQDSIRGPRIINPKCRSGATLPFTLQSREPFIVADYFRHQPLPLEAFFSPAPILFPQPIYLALADKPPQTLLFCSNV